MIPSVNEERKDLDMLAILSIFPTHGGPTSTEGGVSAAVANAVDVIDRSGLDYRVTAMGTIVEGEPDEVFELLRRCHAALREDCDRLYMTVSIDDRKGATGRLAGKLASLEQRLGRSVPR